MEQKPKRNYRHSFWVWITWVKRIIATFALVCVLGLCSLMSIATLHTFLEIPYRGWIAKGYIEERLQFDIPLNSHNVLFHQSWSDETKAKFQFSAPAEEVTSWLEHPNLCFDTPLEDENVEAQGWQFHADWWKPDMVERLVTASCRVDWDRLKHIGQQILIDQTHPDYWTVYFIIWYM
jgi:hypothetical protein